MRMRNHILSALFLWTILSCGKFNPITIENSSLNSQQCDGSEEKCNGTIVVQDSKYVCSLVAASSKITKGQSVRIFIATDGEISSATINNSVVSDLAGKAIFFTPTQTTKYEAVILNKDNHKATCETEVEVVDPVTQPNPLPLCTVSASKAEVNEGDTVRINMTSTDATSVILHDTTLAGPSGFKEFTPALSTTYEGKVSGLGGTNSCSVAVKVIPKPKPTAATCTLTASSNPVDRSSSLAISLKTTNATSATLEGEPIAVGTTTKHYALNANKTFNATVLGDGGNGTCSLAVTVVDPPPPVVPSCTISASAPSVLSGTNVSITLISKNTSSAKLQGLTVATGTVTRSYSPTTTTTYVGEVDGDSAPDCSVVVTVLPRPTCSITASSTSIDKGQSVHISMDSTNATSATLNAANVTVPNYSVTLSPLVTTTYNGIASGNGTTGTCTKTVTVTDRTPTCSLSAPSTVYVNDKFFVTMTHQNITSATINNGSILLSDPKREFTASSTPQTMNFAGNGFGITFAMTCTPISVQVLSRPVICPANAIVGAGEDCTSSVVGAHMARRTQRCDARGEQIITDSFCKVLYCQSMRWLNTATNTCDLGGVGSLCTAPGNNSACKEPNTYCGTDRRCALR